MFEGMRYCILVAGMPATGKTTFAKWLSHKWAIPYMSKDEIKEILFDTLGFNCRKEKVALGTAAERMLYQFAERQMEAGCPLILENNFENCSKEGIIKLLEKYKYQPITVMFDGKLTAIYERFLERDQSPTRHRGHVVNTVYPEVGEREAYVPMGYEAFENKMEQRGFRTFRVGGPCFVIDTTNFSDVKYEEIGEKIKGVIGE